MKKIMIILAIFLSVFAEHLNELAYKCDDKDYNSCTNLAINLLKENDKNYNKINQLLKISCNKDVALACHYLSLSYFNSIGVKKDTKLAKSLANKACDLVYLKSCHNLGNIYKYALANTKINYSKAIKYYELSCNKGLANSCYELANLYQYNLINNDDLMLINHSKACDLEFGASCYQIGYFAYFKKYNLADLKLALKYFLKACELNQNLACMMSANIYEKQKDIENALKYYKKACELRSFTSCNNYERIKDKK